MTITAGNQRGKREARASLGVSAPAAPVPRPGPFEGGGERSRRPAERQDQEGSLHERECERSRRLLVLLLRFLSASLCSMLLQAPLPRLLHHVFPPFDIQSLLKWVIILDFNFYLNIFLNTAPAKMHCRLSYIDCLYPQ